MSRAIVVPPVSWKPEHTSARQPGSTPTKNGSRRNADRLRFLRPVHARSVKRDGGEFPTVTPRCQLQAVKFSRAVLFRQSKGTIVDGPTWGDVSAHRSAKP